MTNAGRRKVLILAGLACVSPMRAHAQTKIRRIGFLAGRSRPDIYYDAFVQAMRDLGYVEGKNLVIEWRFAEGDNEKIARLAGELVRAKPEVIVARQNVAVRALHRETKTIPLVSTSMGDPVGSGYAASLARPGGNVTGLTNIAVDAATKRFELLAAMLPKLSHVAVLVNTGNPIAAATLKSIQDTAQRANIKVLPVDSRQGIERGFATMTSARVDALIVTNDAYFLGQVRQIAELTAKNRLPSISPYREIAIAGGLMSYGQDFSENYRQAAVYVDKILKGAKPGDLPIEQPTKLELVVNRRTAKLLGLAVPPALLVRADKVLD